MFLKIMTMFESHAGLKLSSIALLTLVLAAGRVWAADASASGPHIIMIIRHAEKTGDKADADLSKKGYERAEALAKTFPAHFPRPDYLIATKRSKNSNRPVETITPLAKVLHEEIEAKYSDKEYDHLAHELLSDPKYAGKTVLIAWHHGALPELAKALGAKDAPDKWDDDVFNRVWEITYEKGVATWKDLPENALPEDAEGAGTK
jgi:phosphohistidine phosphatase SixA